MLVWQKVIVPGRGQLNACRDVIMHTQPLCLYLEKHPVTADACVLIRSVSVYAF